MTSLGQGSVQIGFVQYVLGFEQGCLRDPGTTVHKKL